MRKFNLLIMLSLVFYVLLAVAGAVAAYNVRIDVSKAYKVEINRLYNSLTGEEAPDRLSLDSYEYVMRLEYLPAAEQNSDKISDFYISVNEEEMEIRPWFQDGKLRGYVKFVHTDMPYRLEQMFYLWQLGLLIMEAFLLSALLYVKVRVVKPFHRVSELPYEISRGHLTGMVKEEKDRYFGKFIWGISQLKDSLEVSRRRSLELEKEKKQLLLSLSHDIKTPLNTIKLYGKALEEQLYENEEQKHKAAHQIGEKVKEIEMFVEEIMKTSREDILDIKVEKGEFYLADLMDKVLDTYAERCMNRHIELNIGTYENKLLNGDIERTREVFENILENAFKYGDGRKIEIDFCEEDYCQLIRICNTGEPVTENEFNHIFESFFRGANGEGKQGSGLGLYICREIMRKMDGEIFSEILEDGMAFVLVLR